MTVEEEAERMTGSGEVGREVIAPSFGRNTCLRAFWPTASRALRVPRPGRFVAKPCVLFRNAPAPEPSQPFGNAGLAGGTEIECLRVS